MSTFDEELFNKLFDNEEGGKILRKAAYPELIEEMEQVSAKYAKGEVDKVTTPIDRNGLCPHCKKSWDGGDIYQVLSMLDIYLLKPKKDITEAADKYGWTPENKKRFSKVIGIGFNIQSIKEDISLIQCPDCKHVFNINTGQHFLSLNEARNNLYE